MNILLTGTAGFSPSFLAESFLRDKHLVVGIDDFSFGVRNNLKSCFKYKNFIFLEGDARKESNLIKLSREFKIDTIMNMAVAGVPYSLLHPIKTFEIEVALCQAICIASLHVESVKRIIHFSTSEVYGGYRKQNLKEDDIKMPRTTYAAGKVAADALLLSFRNFFTGTILIIRPFNLFGPRQTRALIPSTIKRVLSRQPIKIFGSGEQRRDFTYVEDFVSIVQDFVYMQTWKNFEYNIASGESFSVNEIVNKIAMLMEYNGEIVHVSERTADVDYLLGIRFRKEMTSFDDGLKKTISWYRSNRNFLRYINEQ